MIEIPDSILFHLSYKSSELLGKCGQMIEIKGGGVFFIYFNGESITNKGAYRKNKRVENVFEKNL